MANGQTQPQTLSVDQAASLLSRSRRWVYNLVKDGYIDKAGPGQYRLVSVIRGALAYYEDQLAKGQKAAVATRATEARTREIELRIQERSRDLIAQEDAQAVVSEMAAMVRSEFQGLATRFTRDLEVRRRLEQEIDASFERLSRKAEEASRTLATGRSDLEAEPEA
jgi:predicted DNA-binding transcriptional regulator AlpA